MNRYLVLQCDTITVEYIADILMFDFCAGMSQKRSSELEIVVENWLKRLVVLLSEQNLEHINQLWILVD